VLYELGLPMSAVPLSMRPSAVALPPPSPRRMLTKFFIDRIESFIAQEKEPVRQVIIDARAILSIDITATEQLAEYVAKLHDRGIEFMMAKAHLPLRITVASLGGVLDGCWRFSHVADAIAAFRSVPPKTIDPTDKGPIVSNSSIPSS
jgi:hypothetical protein